VFLFFRPSEGGDVITDFLPSIRETDTLGFDASAFGLGQRSGALADRFFHAGRTNLAQDRDDRFIFRTGDETLWFDRDGPGGAGPVLIADLPDGVRLTADDFVLF
jgi:Ca2+-binding RTX toxin-like protein